MIIFEFDHTLGIATVGFDDCHWHPTGRFVPEVSEWIEQNMKGKISLSCYVVYDYLIYGFPCPFTDDEDAAVFTVFFEDEMDAIKFKLFWL
jgi:hypothetical protein